MYAICCSTCYHGSTNNLPTKKWDSHPKLRSKQIDPMFYAMSVEEEKPMLWEMCNNDCCTIIAHHILDELGNEVDLEIMYSNPYT